MKFRDLLGEAISLTQHNKSLIDTLFHAALDAYASTYRTRKEEFDQITEEMRSGGYDEYGATKLVKLFAKYWLPEYKSQACRHLQRLVALMVGNQHVKVEVDEISSMDKAHVDGLIIRLNTTLFETLDKWIARGAIFDDAVYDNADAEGTIRDFVSVVTNRNGILLKKLQSEYALSRHITELAQILIHEITHVQQHIPQLRDGKQISYSTYMATDKKFHDLYHASRVGAAQNTQEMWYKLWASSPQEIGARAQELALEILRGFDIENGLTDDADYNEYLLSNNEIVDSIVKYAREHYPPPKTRLEQKVFKRYLKLTYQQIKRHLAAITQKRRG